MCSNVTESQTPSSDVGDSGSSPPGFPPEVLPPHPSALLAAEVSTAVSSVCCAAGQLCLKCRFVSAFIGEDGEDLRSGAEAGGAPEEEPAKWANGVGLHLMLSNHVTASQPEV